MVDFAYCAGSPLLIRHLKFVIVVVVVVLAVVILSVDFKPPDEDSKWY